MLLEVLPLLVAAFALGGLVQVVMNPEKVSALLGRDELVARLRSGVELCRTWA